MELTLIQIIVILGLLFLLYKLAIAIKNIFVGTKEIIKHSAEFTSVITKIGKEKFQQKISNIKQKIQDEIDYQDRKKQTILLIALEFNVSLDVAEALFNEYEKMNKFK